MTLAGEDATATEAAEEAAMRQTTAEVEANEVKKAIELSRLEQGLFLLAFKFLLFR